MDVEIIRKTIADLFAPEDAAVLVEGDRATVRIFHTIPNANAEIAEILCRELIRRKGGWIGDARRREGKRCRFIFGARGKP